MTRDIGTSQRTRGLEADSSGHEAKWHYPGQICMNSHAWHLVRILASGVFVLQVVCGAQRVLVIDKMRSDTAS